MTRGREIEGVIREGKRIRTVHLDVRVVASPLDRSRVGIVVPRHQRTAVERNRLKRRLRELVRTGLLPALQGAPAADIAIRARPEAYDAAFQALGADIRTLAARLADRETKE